MKKRLVATRRFGGPPIAVAIVALAALAGSPAWAQIKIGFQAPLTGPAATDGVSAKVAAELAIERINGAGGVLGPEGRARHL